MRASHKDPPVCIVALCDEFGSAFEKKTWFYTCSAEQISDSWQSEILHIALTGIITQRKGLLG